MYCKYCRKLIPDDSKFCVFCGESLIVPQNENESLQSEVEMTEEQKDSKSDNYNGNTFINKYFSKKTIPIYLGIEVGAILIGIIVLVTIVLSMKSSSDKLSMNDANSYESISNTAKDNETNRSYYSAEGEKTEEFTSIQKSSSEQETSNLSENTEAEKYNIFEGLGEQENVITNESITEMQPYEMRGACIPICFVIQPYMTENVTDRSTTPVDIFISYYSVENQQANVVYMNGYMLQYDPFNQDYYRLNNIMGHIGIQGLLQIINDNYSLNLIDFVVINFSLFGKYADKIGGIKLNLRFDEAELKQIEDLYKDRDNKNEVYNLLEKINSNEELFYDDFEALSSICRINPPQITEEMQGKIRMELFRLLLTIAEFRTDDFDILSAFFTNYSVEELSEISEKISGDYVWNQSGGGGQWYNCQTKGYSIIPDNYINYAQNVKYLLLGETNNAIDDSILFVNDKLDEAKQEFNTV